MESVSSSVGAQGCLFIFPLNAFQYCRRIGTVHVAWGGSSLSVAASNHVEVIRTSPNQMYINIGFSSLLVPFQCELAEEPKIKEISWTIWNINKIMKVAFSVLNSFIPYQMSIIIQVSVGHTYNNNSNNVHVNNCTFTNIVVI